MNALFRRILAGTSAILTLSVAVAQTAPDDTINVLCTVDSEVYEATADYMFVDSDGAVVLQGITDCGPESGGGTLLPPTTLTIDFDASQMPSGSITIPSSQQSATVPVHAIIQGFGVGAPFFRDNCTASAGPGNTATVNPSQPSTSFTLGVGTHTISLGCSRSFGAAETQNLNVVPVATKTMPITIVQEGGGDPGPIGCTAPETHFTGVAPVPYVNNYIPGSNSGGWGVAGVNFHPGLGTTWRYWTSTISEVAVSVRSWEFIAPADARIEYQAGDSGPGAASFALAISECPGKFLPADRPGDAGNKSRCGGDRDLKWATGTKHSIETCNLEAGKKYYLNLAAFNIEYYEQCMASPGACMVGSEFRPLTNSLMGTSSIQLRAVKK